MASQGSIGWSSRMIARLASRLSVPLNLNTLSSRPPSPTLRDSLRAVQFILLRLAYPPPVHGGTALVLKNLCPMLNGVVYRRCVRFPPLRSLCFLPPSPISLSTHCSWREERENHKKKKEKKVLEEKILSQKESTLERTPSSWLFTAPRGGFAGHSVKVEFSPDVAIPEP